MTTEELRNVCINIRFLRKKHALSRTAMAHRLHITVKTLDLMEQEIWPDHVRVNLLFDLWKQFRVPI